MAQLWNNKLTRRDFIKVSAAGAVVVAAGCDELIDTTKDEKQIPIGVQLYSVRDVCAKDFAGSVKKVAKIGYEGVEFAGYYNWKAKDLRKLLDDNGLKCCGAHVQIDTLLGDELAKSIEFHKTIGNRFLIVPGLPQKYRTSPKAWMQTALLFNELADKLKPHKMYCGYHNHTVEFQPMEGKVPWDILFGNTKNDVVMQLDIGNGMNGGADPVAILKKYPGRAKTVHAKPYSKTDPKAVIGRDDAPWPKIVSLCRKVAGTEWFIVEQEAYEKSSMDSIEQSLAGLKKYLAKKD